MDASFRMDFAVKTLFEQSSGPPKPFQGFKEIDQMSNSDQTHPLGDEETDQINPAVAKGLTPAQLRWLCGESDDAGRKKLQILRQALFEWVSEHPEYRFTESLFADTVRCALEEFMTRHHAEYAGSKADNHAQSANQN